METEKVADKIDKIQQLSQMNTLGKQISDISTQFSKLSSVINELKTDFSEMKLEASDAEKQSLSFGNILKSVFEKFTLSQVEKLFDEFKNFGRPKMFGLKSLLF